MRKLNRNVVPEPECLTTYHHQTNTWKDVSGCDKELIRNRLEEMQGQCCAYCEGPLDILGQHVEHFRRKSHFPFLTFNWENLFWACDCSDSCGHYKDHGAGPYSPDELINPCVDEPDLFFRFRSDGTIQLRNGLTSEDEHRAKETLRVFNLCPDFGRLRNMRKQAAAPYISMVDDILELDQELRSEFVAAEIQATDGLPFSSVVRHLFEATL